MGRSKNTKWYLNKSKIQQADVCWSKQGGNGKYRVKQGSTVALDNLCKK
ncbi:hypothetical protein SDC9_155937 [bioreactor metagenome]|uniref:Uncharacterized protein n=1 Tax=bioreactor metagenome TaxID=1076179 RepID=A0A645F562_9ZZZZ